MRRPALASRRPPSYAPGYRRFRLRIAGILEAKRLAELESDDPEPTGVLPLETMAEMLATVTNERKAA
jgi:hypothetical protein